MASPDQPAPLSVLGRPRPPPQAHGAAGTGAVRNAGVTTTISAEPGTRGGDRSPPFEFRGFDFFANRDFNELKDASRAYFTPASAEKHQRLPSTWLGDATPPSTPRQSSGDALPAAGGDIFYSPPSRQTPPGERRIYGLRRTQFWWLLGLVALLLIVAIGVGVGVGVGKAASDSSKAAVGAGAASRFVASELVAGPILGLLTNAVALPPQAQLQVRTCLRKPAL